MALAADCGCKLPDCGAAAAGGARVWRGWGGDRGGRRRGVAGAVGGDLVCDTQIKAGGAGI